MFLGLFELEFHWG